MDLDKIRRDYQNKFNLKRMDVEKFRDALRKMTIEKLQDHKQYLLNHPSLEDRMKWINDRIRKNETPLSSKDMEYNAYVNMATDNILEIKLINEELDRRRVPTGGMLPKYYHTTRFKSI
nr:MAG: hypothetical protein [Lake Baikal virophage 14]